MKFLFLLLLLILFDTGFSFAQEDTLRVMRKGNQSGVISASDSVSQNINRLNTMSPIDNLNDFNEGLLTTPYKGMTMSIDRSKKMAFFNSSYSRFIIPAALISYGALVHMNKSLRELDLSTEHEVGEHLSKTIPYDDYMQFVPAVAVYGLDFAGIKAKHNFRDRTMIMATSYLIMGVAVQGLKSTTHITRPDGSNKHSFPSGHTATAFAGAQILFKEYEDVSPWIGIGGYAVATATATMRVLNQKHWVSDVVTGAGIGILSTEISYALLPVWHKVFGIKEKNASLVVMPMVSTESLGAGLVYRF
ncbi:phosphatase PAP2 family protein [uncultured Bacteroides sp.]|uniref:phosphatase PAP2 family protein n=1 Tax=uncultured Bacteroides sp. TaxID=162156 RepID=UPI002AA8C5F6|nr:phosphatase PAP2 family protein [uncultured Bacteroides sp.]